MIIQTGMRTDIPAFYSEWLANRIKEGYVLVRNPYNPLQVTRYELSPEVVDLITFCSKNPKPMFSYMDLLKPYGQYWFVTIILLHFICSGLRKPQLKWKAIHIPVSSVL